MQTIDIKRPNFYPGQYLSAADLIAAQEYQREQDQRHRLAAHTWGIAVGLELEERPKPGGGDAVDVYLKPGYAVDGFGRAIVVLEPYKILEALFTQFPLAPATPKQIIPVWLLYREEKTNPPRPSLANCDAAKQWYRIQETFRIVVGAQSLAQQRDKISVARKMVDAAALLSDASVPYQTLREAGDDLRWLVPLGRVSWSGSQFVQSVDPKTSGDGRQCIGVVAESVLAPAGKVRIRDRSKAAILANETEDLAAIEGSLRIDDNLYVRGKVGIGTLAPEQSLSVNGALNVDQANANAGSVSPGVTFGSGSGEGMASKRTPGGNRFGLDFYTASLARMSINNTGNVGIATIAPTHKLHVNDISGIRQNRLYLSGGDGWSSLSYNAYHKSDNSAWEFPDPSRTAVTIEMDDNKGNPRFEVWSTTKGNKETWQQRLAIDGNSGNVAMAHNGGNVGIGTGTPQAKLEVVGDLKVTGSDLKVTGGNIFVDGIKIPVSVPVSDHVDVVIGKRTLQHPGPVSKGTDTFTVISRLNSVSSSDVIVALSEIGIGVGASHWKVQKRANNPIVPTNPLTTPRSFDVFIDYEVGGLAVLGAYSYVVVFVP